MSNTRRHAVGDGAEDAEVDGYLRAIAPGSGTGGDERQRLTGRFVEVAASFSQRRGIDYGTWREVGVPVDVLRAAGLHPPEHSARSAGVAAVVAQRCRRRPQRSHP
jgi:hypothetical protein